MLLYLDNCCFNRPFDDQSQLKISLEAQAKLHIQQSVLDGKHQLLWSYILEYENAKNPFDNRRDSIYKWKNTAVNTILESENILKLGECYMNLGLKTFDALHVACAYTGGCDYFLTVDKALLNKAIPDIRIINPIEFISEKEG